MDWPVVAIVLTQLLLPLYFVWSPWSRTPPDRMSWWLVVFYGASYLFFISIIGQWSWLGLRVRDAFVVLFVISAAFAWRRHRAKPWRLPCGWTTHVRRLGNVGMGAFFLVLGGFGLSGYATHEPAIQLTFPLVKGDYVVAHGGNQFLINYHNTHPAQRHALDVLGINQYGTRAKGLLPNRNDAYAIYGAHVVSPCSGRVISIANDLPDNTPPMTDPIHPAGNHVLVDCGMAQVLLAHLQPHSVTATIGQQISAGDPLGQVGNSGNSSEPHLHVHAFRVQENGDMPLSIGVPMRFNGRYLTRNDVIEEMR